MFQHERAVDILKDLDADAVSRLLKYGETHKYLSAEVGKGASIRGRTTSDHRLGGQAEVEDLEVGDA